MVCPLPTRKSHDIPRSYLHDIPMLRTFGMASMAPCHSQGLVPPRHRRHRPRCRLQWHPTCRVPKHEMENCTRACSWEASTGTEWNIRHQIWFDVRNENNFTFRLQESCSIPAGISGSDPPTLEESWGHSEWQRPRQATDPQLLSKIIGHVWLGFTPMVVFPPSL